MRNRLREVRLERGWQQVKLAVEAGVSPGTIGNIERFNYPTDSARRLRIAQALGVDVDAIWPRCEEEAAVA
jgi:DNA-binding XRE family transcriptional regulator